MLQYYNMSITTIIRFMLQYYVYVYYFCLSLYIYIYIYYCSIQSPKLGGTVPTWIRPTVPDRTDRLSRARPESGRSSRSTSRRGPVLAFVQVGTEIHEANSRNDQVKGLRLRDRWRLNSFSPNQSKSSLGKVKNTWAIRRCSSCPVVTSARMICSLQSKRLKHTNRLFWRSATRSLTKISL